jgi:hypothetical protein
VYAHPGTYFSTLTVFDSAGSSDSSSVMITVGKAASATVAAPASVALSASGLQVRNLSAKVTRTDTGGPLAGKSVFFGTSNIFVCAATTDAAGVATCSGTIGGANLLAALANGYVATFPGDPDTVGSGGSAKLSLGSGTNAVSAKTNSLRARPTGLSSRLSTLRSVRGTATAGVKKVMVGLVVAPGRCSAMSASGRMHPARRANGECLPQVFRAANGTRHWRLALRRGLARGRYRLYVRPIGKQGLQGRTTVTSFTVG